MLSGIPERHLVFNKNWIKQIPSRFQIIGNIFHQSIEEIFKKEGGLSAIQTLDIVDEKITNHEKKQRQLIGLNNTPPIGSWPEIGKIESYLLNISKPRKKTVKRKSVAAEKKIVTKDKLIVGVVDRIDQFCNRKIQISEYKSGKIFDETGRAYTHHVDQLHFYGGLVFDHYEIFPSYYVLRSLIGDTFSPEPDLKKSLKLLEEARLCLEIVNNEINKLEPFSLARSSDLNCAYCNYKIFCLKFRRNMNLVSLPHGQWVIFGQVKKIELDEKKGKGQIRFMSNKLVEVCISNFFPARYVNKIEVGVTAGITKLHKMEEFKFEFTPQSQIFIKMAT